MRKPFKLRKLNKKALAWRTLVLMILALLGLIIILIFIGKTRVSLTDAFDYLKEIF